MLAQIDLVSISPFVTTGPASKEMFFGRETELRHIEDQVRDRSFAIVGGRRIGKSSILTRLHQLRLGLKNFHSVYLDCSTMRDYESFMDATITEWVPPISSSHFTTFRQFLASDRVPEHLVFLLDEADKLVASERATGWPIFSELRAMSNSGRAEVVLSGERTLREALRDASSPLFNFAVEVSLGPLEFESIEQLVTAPFKQLEIQFVRQRDIVRRVFDATYGHPNITQRLCNRLLGRLNNARKRTITLEDVDAIIDSPDFQETDFLQTYWEAATALERIITLVIAIAPRVYGLSDVEELLERHAKITPSASDVKGALDRLVELRLILTRSKDGYEFAVASFPQILANTTTIGDLLAVFVEEYKKKDRE